MRKTFPILAVALLLAACSPKAAQAPAEEGGNAVIEAIMGRRSIRAYKDTPVPRELLQQLAECGVNAPNAINAQNWAVRIVDSPDYIDGLTAIYKEANAEMVARNPNFKNMFNGAPAIIAVAAPNTVISGVDCGLLGENVMLAAYSLGLGTCCMAGPVRFMNTDPKAAPYLKQLALPDGYELLFVVAVGYPDESPEARPRDYDKIRFVDPVLQ